MNDKTTHNQVTGASETALFFFVPSFRLRRVPRALDNNTKRSHIWPTETSSGRSNKDVARKRTIPTPTRNRTKHPKSICPQMPFLTPHIPQYRNQILSISGCRPGIHAGFQPFGQPCRSLCGTSLFAAKSGKSFEDGVFAFPSLGRRQKTILHKIFYPCEILTRLVEHCGKTRRQRHEAQAAAGLFGGIRVQFRELQRIGGTILRENEFCGDVVNRNKPRRKHPSGAVCPYIRRNGGGTGECQCVNDLSHQLHTTRKKPDAFSMERGTYIVMTRPVPSYLL